MLPTMEKVEGVNAAMASPWFALETLSSRLELTKPGINVQIVSQMRPNIKGPYPPYMSDTRAKVRRKALRISDSRAAGQKRPVIPAPSLEAASNKLGSTIAKPEIRYSARSWVIAIVKQKPTSAAKCRNLFCSLGGSGTSSSSLSTAIDDFSVVVC